MAVLEGDGGRYMVPGLGFLMVGTPADGAKYKVTVDDDNTKAIKALLALGFELEGYVVPEEESEPKPEPKSKAPAKSTVMTTGSFVSNK